MDFKDTTLILPTLNEKEGLPLLLKSINNLYPEIKVIIVDDGSTDGTKKNALSFAKKNENILFFDRSKEKVHGICISAVEAIKKTKTDYFILMDADLQHPPEKIKEIKICLNGKNELVIATRRKVEKWNFQRRLMSGVANWLAKITLFLRRKRIPKDPLSGFFGGETLFFQKLAKENYHAFEPKGYKVLLDFLKILRKSIKAKEIPYNFGERKRGESKIKTKHIFYFVKSLFR